MAYESHWRQAARPIIDRVLRETAGQAPREIRAALHKAYPFGPREHWPYKVWLNEIARQQRRYVVTPRDPAKAAANAQRRMGWHDKHRIEAYEKATGFKFPQQGEADESQ